MDTQAIEEKASLIYGLFSHLTFSPLRSRPRAAARKINYILCGPWVGTESALLYPERTQRRRRRRQKHLVSFLFQSAQNFSPGRRRQQKPFLSYFSVERLQTAAFLLTFRSRRFFSFFFREKKNACRGNLFTLACAERRKICGLALLGCSHQPRCYLHWLFLKIMVPSIKPQIASGEMSYLLLAQKEESSDIFTRRVCRSSLRGRERERDLMAKSPFTEESDSVSFPWFWISCFFSLF